MMSKNGIIYCMLSVVVIAYLVVSLTLTHVMATAAPCKGVSIRVADEGAVAFVTAADIDRELDSITTCMTGCKVAAIPMQSIEDRLNALANIERANVMRLTNDSLLIDVVPMKPVARVFDRTGSYYINRDGKRLTASTAYQVDVPVIIRDKRATLKAEAVLPLLQRIEGHQVWSELVTAVKIDNRNDVLLVPSIAGHVINFGDTRNIDNKFARLFSFYKQVMPVKGWNYYDTVSVKYARQVVATIAPGAKREIINQYRDEDMLEEIDIESMQSDSVSVNDIKPKIL